MAWELETKIMVMALVTVGIALSMMTVYGDFNSKYTTTNSYDNSTLANSLINTQASIYDSTKDLENAAQSFGSGNLLDIVGGLLQGVVGILKLLGGAVTGVVGLLVTSLGFFGLGPTLGLWVTVVTTIGVIVFIISIILRRIRG